MDANQGNQSGHHSAIQHGAQSGSAASVGQQPFRLLDLPAELVVMIFRHRNSILLSSFINAVIVLCQQGQWWIVRNIVELYEKELLNNKEFCREVFACFKEGGLGNFPQTPRSLYPPKSDKSYPVQIFQAAVRFNTAERLELERQYRVAVLDYRRLALHHSPAYAKGSDKPDAVTRKELALRSSSHIGQSYINLIDQAKATNNLALATMIEVARERQARAEGASNKKAQIIYKVLTRLLSDAEFLKHTCRGCGERPAREKTRSTLPHCRDCFPIHVQLNMIPVQHLTDLRIRTHSQEPQTGEHWVKVCEGTDGEKYVPKLEADLLCKLYHGVDLSTAQQMVAAGTLIVHDMSINATNYSYGAMVAGGISQQKLLRNARFQVYEQGEINHGDTWVVRAEVVPARLDTGMVRLLEEEIKPSVVSIQRWIDIINAVKQFMAIDIKDRDAPSLEWVGDRTTNFWFTQFQSVGRLTLSEVQPYDIVRVDAFDGIDGVDPHPLDKWSYTRRQCQILAWVIHGRVSMNQIVGLSKDERQCNLTVYLTTAAVVLCIFDGWDKELAVLTRDLINLGLAATAKGAIHPKYPGDRIWPFFLMVRNYLATTQAIYPVIEAQQLSEVPEVIARALADDFITAFIGHSNFFARVWVGIGSTLRYKHVRLLYRGAGDGLFPVATLDLKTLTVLDAVVRCLPPSSILLTHDLDQYPAEQWERYGSVTWSDEAPAQ